MANFNVLCNPETNNYIESNYLEPVRQLSG